MTDILHMNPACRMIKQFIKTLETIHIKIFASNYPLPTPWGKVSLTNHCSFRYPSGHVTCGENPFETKSDATTTMWTDNKIDQTRYFWGSAMHYAYQYGTYLVERSSKTVCVVLFKDFSINTQWTHTYMCMWGYQLDTSRDRLWAKRAVC